MHRRLTRRAVVTVTLVVSAGIVILGDPRLALAAESLLSQIKARGTLRVGLEGTYPPFNYQDVSGALVGYEVDFANALTRQLGVKADFQPAPWASLLGGLEAGRIDVVINQVGSTEERKKKYDFSEPYTISGMQIIVRKGEEGRFRTPSDLAGTSVGVGLGTNYERWLKENVPKADVHTYDDDPTKCQDLRAGRVDAVLNDRLVAAELVKKSGGVFVGTGEPFNIQPIGIALPKDPDLLAALNKAIEAMRASGELTRISEKWFGLDVSK